MWRSWSKSSSKISDHFLSSPNHKHHHNQQQHHLFRCSSFKDIENLCNVDNNNDNNHLNKSDNTVSPSSPSNNTSCKHQQSLSTQTRRSIFHRVRTVNTLLRQWQTRSDPQKSPDPFPQNDITPKTPTTPSTTRIVIYYTSLRVVRPTFEACRATLSILQGFQIQLDERDLVMDLGFMSELRELVGLKPNEELTLPRVFIGGRYIGGSEEIVRLHETGELKKLVSRVPRKKPGTCDTCGGYRFMLCDECNGSHKIFSEKVGFRSCKACNENGLIRCPDCCSPNLCRPILAPIINDC